jgi:hypothetical protein
LVLTSLKANLNVFNSPVYVPEIETGRHVKNNACTVEIKIKWMIQKHIPLKIYFIYKVAGEKSRRAISN